MRKLDKTPAKVKLMRVSGRISPIRVSTERGSGLYKCSFATSLKIDQKCYGEYLSITS